MAEFKKRIIGLGNPLLDIIAKCDDDFLKKYDLKADDAILADDEKHGNLCQDIVDKYPVEYIAGGSVQNTMRVAQWFFTPRNVSVFFGCIGDDGFGAKMRTKVDEDGVLACYMIEPKVPTGTCACLLTNNGKYRSLCAYLGASQKFNASHLKENLSIIESGDIFYVSGFHMIVSMEATQLLAQKAHESSGKLFAINLSAPYISEIFLDKFLAILPFADLLFGNDSECKAFAKAMNWEADNVEEITQKMANYEHRRPRIVVITQGKEDVIIAYTANSDATGKRLEKYSVPVLTDTEIVDTNGAGDAFVGGFLAYKLMDKSMKECVEAGIYAAQDVIKNSGCIFSSTNKMKLI